MAFRRVRLAGLALLTLLQPSACGRDRCSVDCDGDADIDADSDVDADADGDGGADADSGADEELDAAVDAEPPDAGAGCVRGHEVGTACAGEPPETCYEGSVGTEDVGVCRCGTRRCVDGTWLWCEGQVLDSPEVCDFLDNDCDGEVDDGVSCEF